MAEMSLRFQRVAATQVLTLDTTGLYAANLGSTIIRNSFTDALVFRHDQFASFSFFCTASAWFAPDQGLEAIRIGARFMRCTNHRVPVGSWPTNPVRRDAAKGAWHTG